MLLAIVLAFGSSALIAWGLTVFVAWSFWKCFLAVILTQAVLGMIGSGK